jgi:membrane-bound serine protease (ClpP class)
MLFRFPGQPMPLAFSVLIPTVVTISAFFIGVATLAFRAQRSIPQTGNEALVGLIGEVVQDLRLEGKVFVNGELWNAQANEPIPAGTRVRVAAVDSLKLHVRQISDS